MTSDICTARMECAWSRWTSKSFTSKGNQVSCAEINMCSRNSCLTSPAELREGLAWVYFTVVKYLTLVSGLLKGGC